MSNVLLIVAGAAIMVLGVTILPIGLVVVLGAICVFLGIGGLVYKGRPGRTMDVALVVAEEKLQTIEEVKQSVDKVEIPVTLFWEDSELKAYYKNRYLGRIDHECCRHLLKLVKKNSVKSARLDASGFERSREGDAVFSVHIEAE